MARVLERFRDLCREPAPHLLPAVLLSCERGFGISHLIGKGSTDLFELFACDPEHFKLLLGDWVMRRGEIEAYLLLAADYIGHLNKRGDVPKLYAKGLGIVVEADGGAKVPGELPLGGQADPKGLVVGADQLPLCCQEI